MKIAFCNSCLRRDFDYDMMQVCPDCNLPLTPEEDRDDAALGQEKDQEVPEVRPSTQDEEKLRKAWIKMLNEATDRNRRTI